MSKSKGVERCHRIKLGERYMSEVMLILIKNLIYTQVNFISDFRIVIFKNTHCSVIFPEINLVSPLQVSVAKLTTAFCNFLQYLLSIIFPEINYFLLTKKYFVTHKFLATNL